MRDALQAAGGTSSTDSCGPSPADFASKVNLRAMSAAGSQGGVLISQAPRQKPTNSSFLSSGPTSDLVTTKPRQPSLNPGVTGGGISAKGASIDENSVFEAEELGVGDAIGSAGMVSHLMPNLVLCSRQVLFYVRKSIKRKILFLEKWHA